MKPQVKIVQIEPKQDMENIQYPRANGCPPGYTYEEYSASDIKAFGMLR